MDAIKFIKEYKRMCKNYQSCLDCPLAKENNGHEIYCTDFMTEFTEKTFEIVSKWSDNHHPITNRKKFLEVFGINFVDAILETNWLDDEYKEIK